MTGDFTKPDALYPVLKNIIIIYLQKGQMG